MSRNLLGIPPVTLEWVEADYAAWLRGPATLDAALHGVLLDTLLARYKALLTLYGTTVTMTTGARANRAAWAAFDREEARQEQRDIRRGGGTR